MVIPLPCAQRRSVNTMAACIPHAGGHSIERRKSLRTASGLRDGISGCNPISRLPIPGKRCLFCSRIGSDRVRSDRRERPCVTMAL